MKATLIRRRYLHRNHSCNLSRQKRETAQVSFSCSYGYSPELDCVLVAFAYCRQSSTQSDEFCRETGRNEANVKLNRLLEGEQNVPDTFVFTAIDMMRIFNTLHQQYPHMLEEEVELPNVPRRLGQSKPNLFENNVAKEIHDNCHEDMVSFVESLSTEEFRDFNDARYEKEEKSGKFDPFTRLIQMITPAGMGTGA